MNALFIILARYWRLEKNGKSVISYRSLYPLHFCKRYVRNSFASGASIGSATPYLQRQSKMRTDPHYRRLFGP